MLTITMYNYIEDIIGTALFVMNGAAPDPARAGLFTVDNNCFAQ